MNPIWIDNLIHPPRDWHPQFIHHNLLVIGYSAWQGYLQSGAGLVVCQLAATLPEAIDWTLNSLPLTLRFVPESELAQATQMADLPLEPAAMPGLREALATYDPAEAVLLLVCGNGEVNLSLLYLAISPSDCYKQVRCRWDEFAPALAL